MKHFLVLGILLLLAGCTASPPAPVLEAAKDLPVEEKPELRVNRPQSHTIKSGETLAGIAFEYGLDYQELALWNGIANPNSIYAGDVIRLAPPAISPSTAAVPTQRSEIIEPVQSVQPAQPVRIAKPGATPSSASAAKKSAISGAANAASLGANIASLGASAAAAESAIPSVSAEAESEIVIRGNAPVKDRPVAEKFAYNQRTLQKLQSEHDAIDAPPIPDSSQVALAAPAPSAAAPQKVRRRFDVDWSWPAAGEITRKFSEESKGVDIAGQKGAPVFAAANGKVVYTGSGVKGYGRLVILKHGNDYLSAYAHNDTILVREGQKVARGAQIATIGDSGAAQVMLHLEIRKSGQPFDPLQVLPQNR